MKDYQYISRYFFIDWAMFIIIIIAFIVSLKHQKKIVGLRIITYYLGAAVLENCISGYFEFLKGNMLIVEINVGAFSIIEFIIFCIYIHNTISSRIMKGVIKFFYWTFIAFLFWGWITFKTFYIPGLAYVLEAIYLIIPCLVYYYELFITPKLVFLKTNPSFWIITGILFYNSCSLPMFLIVNYVYKKLPSYVNLFFSLTFILYIILYLLFIRAYLCKPKTSLHNASLTV